MCIIIGKSIRTTVKNEDSQHPFDERIIWKYFDGTATSEEEQELSQWLATSEKHRCEVAELRAVRQRFAKWRSTLYGPARFIRSLNRLNSRIDALENAPCTAQRPHRLSNLFGHIRIHSLLRTAAVVAVVALTGMFAWRTALMPAPITYFNADTTIMHVAMPDGSDIWLTPGSTLCYDETFHTDERRVHLDGEAYFDVEHDAKHPFDVVTPNLRVRVLGTVFSVRSLRGDHMAETTLAEGAVSLQRADGSNLIRLHPGQRAIYDTQDEQLEIKEVPVGDHLALSYGIITLDGVPLRQDGTPWKISLDGEWRFELFRSPQLLPEQFASPELDDRTWRTIAVPSNWTLQDTFDKPIYTNAKMPFENRPPFVPDENPTGVYRRAFSLPADWTARRIVLHVGGAESYLEVYLNGSFVGMGNAVPETRESSGLQSDPLVRLQLHRRSGPVVDGGDLPERLALFHRSGVV